MMVVDGYGVWAMVVCLVVVVAVFFCDWWLMGFDFDLVFILFYFFI